MANVIYSGWNNETGRYESKMSDGSIRESKMSDGSIRVRKYAAVDADGAEIGLYDSRDAAAGACQDAAREADSDGEGYEVVERMVEV